MSKRMSDAHDRIGKVAHVDYLAAKDAAAYCCLSRSQFDAKAAPHLPAFNVCGKKVYCKADLQAFIESEPWQRSPNGAKAGRSTGPRTGAASVAHLVPYPETMPKGSGRSRKRKYRRAKDSYIHPTLTR